MTAMKTHVPVGPASPAVSRFADRCSDCGHCVSACAESIGPAQHWLDGEAFACVSCGQCVASCPERALQVKSQIEQVKEAVKDPQKIVVFSTSPAVRVGLGDAFGCQPGAFVESQMVDALRRLGGDYVLDVTFSADLTIMEECTEFLQRLLGKKGVLPQFTSCCPAWVKYAETFLPDILPHISTAKSPIGMQGATIKTYFAKERNVDPRRIISVAVTPCTAKKYEISRSEFNSAGKELGIDGLRDNDYVLTTKEIAQWLDEEGISFDSLSATATFDSLMGKGSGAGIIFGNSGGVMEAALRMAYTALTGNQPDELLLDFKPVRGLQDVKTAEVQLLGQTLRVAVVYGTKNVEEHLPELMKTYHFIEVMTCPGGCISGAGQPERDCVPVADSLRQARIRSLYQADVDSAAKISSANPDIQRVYQQFYGQPLSEKSERLLHTSYENRSALRGKGFK